MKTITKTAKLAFVAMLVIFCFACEEKEKAKTEADEVAKTETEALAKAAAAEAFAKAQAEAEAGSVKLLESITDDNGEVQKKFEYDEQNRIVKMYDGSTKMITYADDLITVEKVEKVWGANIKSTTKFVRKGNTIKSTTKFVSNDTITVGDNEKLTVNEDGYIVKRERNSNDVSYEYQYQDGNLIEVTSISLESEHSDTYSYKYDDKKSPFYNCKTPRWLLEYLSESKNNVIFLDRNGESGNTFTKYKYEYDSDGFPTKQTAEGNFEDGTYYTIITRYTYRSGTKQ